jgi:hyperosmotically inducible protein
MRHSGIHTTWLIAAGAALALPACGQPGADSASQNQWASVPSNSAASGQSAPDDRADAAAAAGEHAEQRAPHESTLAADSARDTTITEEVNAAFAKDPQLQSAKIEVDTHNGRVELTGSVPNAGARDRATIVASVVDGVVAVENRLAVAGST